MSVSVSSLADSIRSKNAGPFWVTIDIFCGDDTSFKRLSHGLDTQQLAIALNQVEHTIKRFDIESLNVIKFSLPRPVVQGHRLDRDMHGAQWALLIGEIVIAED